MKELKNCPFCGHIPDMSDGDTLYPTGTGWKDEGEYRSYHNFREVPKEQWCYGMNCPVVAGGCGAEIVGDSRQEAIDKWNTRVSREYTMSEVTNVKKKKRKERCPHCKATWKGDGWTLVCPACGQINAGNR